MHHDPSLPSQFFSILGEFVIPVLYGLFWIGGPILCVSLVKSKGLPVVFGAIGLVFYGIVLLLNLDWIVPLVIFGPIAFVVLAAGGLKDMFK